MKLDTNKDLAMLGYSGLDRLERFQAQHLDALGAPLVVDGIAGPITLAALATSASQRLDLEGKIPKGIEGGRAAFLLAALAYHAQGMCEVPAGSNCVPGLEKRAQGKPWCDFFVHQCYHDATGAWLFGGYRGSTRMTLSRATKVGLTYDTGATILPGDVGFVLGSNNKPRHTYIVLRCDSQSVRKINTVEGNVSNRVAIRERAVPAIWYDPFGDTIERRRSVAAVLEYGLADSVRRAGGESTR